MIKIEIEKKTRKVKTNNIIIGNDGENLQDTLQFCFKDEFVDGQARLELKFQNGETTFVILDKIEQTYTTLLSNVMTKRGKVFAQLVITENGINDKIPVFKSDMFYFICNQSINAEEETREPYVEWIDRANAKLNEVDNLDIEANKVNDTTTITITKKDKSTKIVEVKDGEKGEKGDTGDKGDTYQVNEEDLKAIAKEITDNANSDFNKNVIDKTNLFNTNAETKTTEFNTNVIESTTTFNTNSDNKIKEYNDNATSNTTAFNDNASNKTTYYNNNATTKLNEYNTNASTKLQEYNDNAIQKIEEYDAHSEELDNKIVSTRNELERVKNDILETGTDTDTFVHLEDSAMAEYQELEVDGVCEQETTSGKNFANITRVVPYNYSATLYEDVVNINGTSTQAGNVGMYLNDSEGITLKANETYTVSVYIDGTVTGGTYKSIYLQGMSIGAFGSNKVVRKTMTLTEDKLCKILSFDISANCVFTNMKVRVQIEKGDIGTDYEKYTGGQPSPSPDYPQPISVIENSLKITSCNKNLLDYKDIPNWGVWTEYAAASGIIKRLKLKPNTDYTMSSDVPLGSTCLIYFNGTDTISDGIYLNHSITKTTDSNGNLYIGMFKNRDYYNDIVSGKYYIQLEESDQTTPNEQHLETQITANLPEGEFIGKINDRYKDTLKVEYNETDGQYHLVLNKMIGKVVLYGSEDWKNNINGTNTYRFSLYFPQAKNQVAGYCSHNKYVDSGISLDEEVIGVYGNILYFRIRKNIISTYDVTLFKQWLSTNKPIVYYVLATPYTVDLGIVDQLITYNEITNLFTDSDLMPTINAKYYRTFEKTIQNLQVNEKALKQELIDINNRLSALETAQTSVVSESEVVE